MRAVDFCLEEASRLRTLASDSTNDCQRIELLRRAAEFEDLAYSAGDQRKQDENLQTRTQARAITWLVDAHHAAAGLSRRLRLRTRAAGKAHQRILERLCADAVLR